MLAWIALYLTNAFLLKKNGGKIFTPLCNMFHGWED